MNREKRGELTRQALIDEGKRQLAAQGYHGTGIKQILDAVSVPKGSFYNYFPSKEAFVTAIIDDYSDHNLELFRQFVAKSTRSPLETLLDIHEHMFQQFEQAQCERGCLVGTLAAEIGAASAQCQQALTRSREQWQARVSVLVARAQSANELRRDLSPEQLAEVYWAAWEGALIRMRLDGNTQGARAILNTLVAAFRTDNAQAQAA